MIKRTPTLRFKGFTDEWEEKTLGEVTTKTTEKNADKFYNETFTNSAEFGIVSQRDFFDNDITNAENINTYYIVKQEDFVYNPRISKYAPVGPINRNKLGRVGVISPLYTVMTPKGINTSFLEYYFKNENWHNYMYQNGDTGARSDRFSIKDNLFFQMPIKHPTATIEQTKIGNLFKTLDTRIAQQQKKHDALVNVKKALLQKMFLQSGKTLPEVRFKGFEEDWEEKSLGDIVLDLRSGLSRMLSNEDIGLPVVRANNINDGRLNMDDDIKYWYSVDPQGANTTNYLIEEGDVLINFINSEAKMGTATIVEKKPLRNTIYTTNILKLKINQKCINTFFLALTMTEDYKDYIKGISKIAVNQASFTTVDYKNYKMLIPQVPEQTKIGNLFKTVDNLIDLNKQKLEKLKDIKKACLEKMFV